MKQYIKWFKTLHLQLYWNEAKKINIKVQFTECRILTLEEWSTEVIHCT